MDWDRDSWVEGDPEIEEPAEGVDIMALVDTDLDAHPDDALEVAQMLAEARVVEDRHARTLAALRQTLELTQTELAQRLGVTQPTVSDLERGRYANMRVSTLLGYLDALGLRPRIIVDVPGQGQVDVTTLADYAA